MNEIYVWCEPVCQKCRTALSGKEYRNGDIGRLRRYAKSLGWKVINGKTLCNKCIDEIGEGEEA